MLTPDRTADPEDRLLQLELSREIQQALNTLPEDQRLVIVLADIQGLSYEEISEVTRTSLGTVKSRIHYAKRALRVALERANVHE